MPVLIGDCMKDAAIFLNDRNQRLYTNEALLPYAKRAHKELEHYLDLQGTRVLDEVSAIIQVPTGDLNLTLPDDFVSPIELWERPKGSDRFFNPMEEKRWEPDERPQTSLNIWVWRDQQVLFLGATSDREVKLKYKKSFLPITSINTPVGIYDADNFLSSRIAALAALYLGENPTRAGALQSDASEALSVLLRTEVKTQQGRSVRRQRYGSAWRRV